jgi:hypothetical protein
VNVDHLFEGTVADNNPDAHAKGRYSRKSRSPGEKHWAAKLSDADVQQIRSLAASGRRQIDLARRFQVTPARISSIVLRRSWRHVP